MVSNSDDHENVLHLRNRLVELGTDRFLVSLLEQEPELTNDIKYHIDSISTNLNTLVYVSGEDATPTRSELHASNHLPRWSSQLLLDSPKDHREIILDFLAKSNHPLTIFFNDLNEPKVAKFEDEYILDLAVLRIGQKVFWPGLTERTDCRLIHSENDFDGDAMWIECTSLDFSENQRFLPIRGEDHLPFVLTRNYDLFGHEGENQGHTDSNKWWSIVEEYDFDFALEVAAWLIEEIEEEYLSEASNLFGLSKRINKFE